MRALTVLYDDRCAFCRRCCDWLRAQPPLVALEFWPARSLTVGQLFPGLLREAGEELLVVDDEGGVYRGDEAFLMCLWAVEPTREWSLVLASPQWRHVARGFFKQLSARRYWLSQLIAWWHGDRWRDECADGRCGR